MKAKCPDTTWLPPEYFENQRKVTPAMLLPYANRHIAWNWTGDVVLDSRRYRE
jgi:hypothetical protein